MPNPSIERTPSAAYGLQAPLMSNARLERVVVFQEFLRWEAKW